MIEYWPSLTELVFGLILAFFGFPLARFVFALAGAVLGFTLGIAGYTALVAGLGGPLWDLPPWLFGVLGALLLGGLGFWLYAAAVLLGMGALGWGTGLLAAQVLGLQAWVATTLAVLVAIGGMVAAFTLDLPRRLLIGVTAVVGAGLTMDAVMAFRGVSRDWADYLSWGWHLIWPAAFVGLAVLAIISQSRQRSAKSLRAAYR